MSKVIDLPIRPGAAKPASICPQLRQLSTIIDRSNGRWKLMLRYGGWIEKTPPFATSVDAVAWQVERKAGYNNDVEDSILLT